jgi:hypothetical protein
VLIDLPAGAHDEALAFWAGATGSEPQPSGEPEYTRLGLQGGLELSVQRLGDGDAPRVHLDIETDDVAAETARLVGLGARVVTAHDGWNVMADTAGTVFCVVGVQTGDEFDRHASTWP